MSFSIGLSYDGQTGRPVETEGERWTMCARLMTTMTAAMLMTCAILPATEKSNRKAYRVPAAFVNSGGPVRSVSIDSVDAPAELLVRSSSELTAEKQKLIAWHFRNAANLAEAFAKKERLTIQRTALPARVEMFKNPESLSIATGLPHSERLGEVVARMDLNQGVVYLGRSTPEDLYVELGKWLFYERGYRWGQDEAADRKHLALAEKFAAYCLEEKNWTEAGGSKDGIR